MIQIDIDMPEDCDACPCCEMYDHQENWGKCRITNKEFCCLGTVDDKGDYHRPDWCPLVEVEKDTRPKKGKWLDFSNEGYVECPFCHSATNCDGNKEELHYCYSCGADLRGEA